MFFNLIHVSSCTCLSNHPCEPSESSPTVPALADSLLQTIEKVLHPSSHLVPPVSPTGAVGDNGAADVHLIFSVALPRLLRVLPPSHSRAVNLHPNENEIKTMLRKYVRLHWPGQWKPQKRWRHQVQGWWRRGQAYWPVSKQRLRLKTTELGSPFMRRQVVMGAPWWGSLLSTERKCDAETNPVKPLWSVPNQVTCSLDKGTYLTSYHSHKSQETPIHGLGLIKGQIRPWLSS